MAWKGGVTMAKLTLTEKEKASASYLSWNDAALGRAVKKMALDIEDHHGDQAIALSSCACMLACSSAERGIARTEINLEGLTEQDEEYGDWTIIIIKNSSAR
jgi:hypothetical protein